MNAASKFRSMGKQSWRWLMKMAPVLGPLVYASRGHHTTLRPGPALTCTAQSSSSSLQHGVGCEKEKYFWQALRGCQGNSSLPSRDDEFGGEGESFEGNWKREERLFGANAAERKREREQEVGVADVDWLKLTDGELQRQCRVETLRSSGPGGQHRNKTESAVRLLHLPTGLVAFVMISTSLALSFLFVLHSLCLRASKLCPLLVHSRN